MFKRSLINQKVVAGMLCVNEETINLGNTSNTNTIFREHTFTVIRPDIFGDSNQVKGRDNTKSLAGKLMDSTKSLIPKGKRSDDQLIACDIFPDYVLINPSEWGLILMKMKDGSEIEKTDDYNKLISLREYVGYDNDLSISYQFKLKVENV